MLVVPSASDFIAEVLLPAGIGNVSVTVNGAPVTMTAASPDNGRYTGTFTPSPAGGSRSTQP